MSGFAATFLIRALTPLHIGSDSVYDPMSFVLDEQRAELTPIEPLEFIRSLDPADLRELRKICMEGSLQSLLRVYKFMRKQSFQGRRIPVSPQIVEHYQETLRIGTEQTRQIQEKLNKFVIHRTAFQTSTNRPYLPGSSIKGAIRTAYLSLLCQEQRVRLSGRQNSFELEKRLLKGAYGTDPFRLLKISDFVPVGEAPVRIRYAINRKKSGKPADSGIYQILETVQPGAVFQGTIQLDSPLDGSGIRTPLSMARLEEALSAFFRHQWGREQNELALLTDSRPQEAPGGSLMRLGHHSGAECVTLEGLRRIRVRTGRTTSEVRDGATTVWLASDSRKADPRHQESPPLGWIQLQRASETEKQQAKSSESQWRMQARVQEKQRLERLQELQREAEARRQALQRRQEEERRRQEEERRREEEWAKLTPFERDLLSVRQGRGGQEELAAIVRRIDEFSEQESKQLAQALKEAYLSQGRWEVAAKQKKQINRVAKLKRILGEE
ncbi:MAG: type III-A CRISPR-associated RAMP protein Csm5 [Acidobacteriota bacterium]